MPPLISLVYLGCKDLANCMYLYFSKKYKIHPVASQSSFPLPLPVLTSLTLGPPTSGPCFSCHCNCLLLSHTCLSWLRSRRIEGLASELTLAFFCILYSVFRWVKGGRVFCPGTSDPRLPSRGSLTSRQLN